MIIVNRINRIPQNEGKGVSGVRGGGGVEGRDGLRNTFFQPFGPQFGLKIRGGGGRGGGGAALARSTTVTCKCKNGIPHEDFAVSLQEAMPFT